MLSNTEIAALLNERGIKSGRNRTFTRQMISYISQHHGLKTVQQRYEEMGYTPQNEIIRKTNLDRKQLLKLRRNEIIEDFKKAESTYFYRIEDFKAYMAR